MMQKKQAEVQKKTAAATHSKRVTNNIVAQQKARQFEEIFNQLDSDRDGQISAFRIDISTLEPELLQVLSPLFIEMEELGISLNLEEFTDAADRLYKSVSLPDKNVLVGRNRSRSKGNREQTSTFQPTINNNSKRLASR